MNLLQLHIQCSSYLIWLPTLLLMTFSTIVMCYCTIVVVVKLVLGNIPVISLHRGIEFIPVTLQRIPLYRFCINYIFCGLEEARKSQIEWLTLKYTNLLA